jgi:hypothetical protein
LHEAEYSFANELDIPFHVGLIVYCEIDAELVGENTSRHIKVSGDLRGQQCHRHLRGHLGTIRNRRAFYLPISATERQPAAINHHPIRRMIHLAATIDPTHFPGLSRNAWI